MLLACGSRRYTTLLTNKGSLKEVKKHNAYGDFSFD